MATTPEDRRSKPKVQKYAAGQKVGMAAGGAVSRVPEYDQKNDPLAFINRMVRNPIQQGVNFLGDFSGGARDKVGAGAGDLLFGSVDPGYYANQNRQAQKNGGGGGSVQGVPEGIRRPGFGEGLNRAAPRQQAPMEQPKDLSDYLRMAMELIGNQGGQGGVNYDPQRATLRQNAGENDARLEAMYRQLRGSIDADAPVIQGAYQEAIDKTAGNAQTAQAQTQAATNAALAQQNAVLGNLGIQEAQGNQIQQGTDLSTQTAASIGDQASRGQLAGDRLVSNQATAVGHNTNIGNATGLEGNLQRAANQSRLQALLAEIDMQEQTQNASRQDNSFGQQLGLAQELLGFDRYNQERQDNLQMSAAEMANEREMAALKAQGSAMPDLGTYLQAMGQDASFLSKDPSGAARILDVLRKFQLTQ